MKSYKLIIKDYDSEENLNSVEILKFDSLKESQEYMENVFYSELDYYPDIPEDKKIIQEYSDYWYLSDTNFEIYPTQTLWHSRVSCRIEEIEENKNNITFTTKDGETYSFAGRLVEAKLTK